MPKEYGTPGPRAIYPDMCTSRSIAQCSLAAQLLFDRLIVQADDQGRIEGDALVLKSLCLPLVAEAPAIATGRGSRRVPGIDDLLAELEAEDLVHRYTAGRSVLTQLVTWWRWQQGQRRAYPSRWSSPEDWTDAVYGLGGDTPASYKLLASAAPCGTAPHNAAWRGISPQSAASEPKNAALTRAQLPAAPAAPALSGALTVPPPTPAGGGRPSRSNGTSPRQLAAARAEEAEREEKAKRWRVQQRQLAYYRGALTQQQAADMNASDAPLEEIPGWAEYQAAKADDDVPWLNGTGTAEVPA